MLKSRELPREQERHTMGKIHQFDMELATRHGISAAIIFNALAAAMNSSDAILHKGKQWVSVSVAQLERSFPYMGEKQISYAMRTLLDAGLIKTGSVGNCAATKTRSFTLTEAGKVAARC